MGKLDVPEGEEWQDGYNWFTTCEFRGIKIFIVVMDRE